MSMRSPEEIQEIRKKAIAIEFRAKHDADFLQKLKDDPLGTLQAEGIDSPTAREFVTELQGGTPVAILQPEPFAPVLMEGWCDGITCIFTTCTFLTANPPEHIPEE
jgi:hypothetical protein